MKERRKEARPTRHIDHRPGYVLNEKNSAWLFWCMNAAFPLILGSEVNLEICYKEADFQTAVSTPKLNRNMDLAQHCHLLVVAWKRTTSSLKRPFLRVGKPVAYKE